jgi:hypothetical protein
MINMYLDITDGKQINSAVSTSKNQQCLCTRFMLLPYNTARRFIDSRSESIVVGHE